jgi:uncharacterized membrane protein
MLLIGGMLAWLSVARYAAYHPQMFDVRNMAQAIWSATQGEPLLFTQPFGARSRLQGHVEAIYFLFAPFYALWPDPRLLLVSQAGLFALGALPVFWMTQRRTDSGSAALIMALIYLLYPVAQTAVLFDFHGDTLAMAPLLFALDALDRRAWWVYGLAVGLALLCKFYVALPVAAMGFVIFMWGGERRAGALTLAAGVAYGALLVLVVRPFFAEADVAQSMAGYTNFYFNSERLGQDFGFRVANLVLVFGMALLLLPRGWRWLLPALPLVAGLLVTTGPGHADYRSHHYALLVPFILMAMIDAVGRMKARQEARHEVDPDAQQHKGRHWKNDLRFTLVLVVVANVMLVNTPLSPIYWTQPSWHWMKGPVAYMPTARDELKDAFLAEHVPPDVPLVASILLAPHLANRDTIYLGNNAADRLPVEERLALTLPQVEYVVIDGLLDYGLVEGLTDFERPVAAYALRDPAFHLVQARDGLLLFERTPPPAEVLEQRVDVRPADEAPPVQARFGEAIGLVAADISPLAGRRFQANFVWHVNDALPANAAYVAVSRLYDANGEPVEGARMVHLPTYALHPAEEWQAGTLIEETFEVEVPPEVPPGRYRWRVAWYNLLVPGAYRTDESSRLAGSDIVGVATLEVRE